MTRDRSHIALILKGKDTFLCSCEVKGLGFGVGRRGYVDWGLEVIGEFLGVAVVECEPPQQIVSLGKKGKKKSSF